MKQSVAIIGGGPAGILCALFLDPKLYDVTIYEKGNTLGRKFLVAGKGGFNLTHSENISDFIKRYTPSIFLQTAITNFDNQQLRLWLEELGIPTFEGSSKRVYPEKGIKPIQVLQTLKDRLIKKGVDLAFNNEWKGWDNDQLIFENDKRIKPDYVVFGLGGGSWKVTGSAGDWLSLFNDKEIQTNRFQPSNCGYQIKWDNSIIEKYAGKPFKNIAITCGSKVQKGEVVLTEMGLEGNAIYALSPEIRQQLNRSNKADIQIDFKPMLDVQEIELKLKRSNYNKISDRLKHDLKLDKPIIELLKQKLDKDSFLDNHLLAQNIKSFNLVVTGTSSLNEAISTVGGISVTELDTNFQLNKIPNHFCIGEMVDWDAPTGGYLLQACFSMGVTLAKYLNSKEK